VRAVKGALVVACATLILTACETGAVVVLEWVRDRMVQKFDPAARVEIDSRLRDLRNASDARNLPAAADHAARLGARFR
jgi:hypothetical protein